MFNDEWDKLLALKTRLLMAPDKEAELAQLDPDEAVIEVYADDVEQAMLIVAANRMSELLGIACYRLDVEGGKPQMIFSFGISVDDAKVRMRRLYEAREREAQCGLESE